MYLQTSVRFVSRWRFHFFSVQNCETIVWQGTTFPLRFRFRISTSVLNKCETMPAIDLVFAGENNGINGNLCAAKLMTFLQGFFSQYVLPASI